MHNKLSIRYYWLSHTKEDYWIAKYYPNINEDENNFTSEQDAIEWLLKQKEQDNDFGDWQHFTLEKTYTI